MSRIWWSHELTAANIIQEVEVSIELLPGKQLRATSGKRLQGIDGKVAPVSPADGFPEDVGASEGPESLASGAKTDD